MPKLKTKKKIKTIRPAFDKPESKEMTEGEVEDTVLSKSSSTAKSRRSTKKKIKTIRPAFDKPESDEMTEEEVIALQDIVLSKPDASAKPFLNTAWPVLLVVSILTCIGIPFIPAAERVLLGSFVLCAAIWSTYKIFKFEKDLHQWYIDNPEFAPKSKKQRRRAKSPSGKPIMMKR